MNRSMRTAGRFWTLADLGVLLLPLLAVWFGFRELGGWPHNDDPFYGRSVQWAVEDGRLELARQKGVLSASTVTHVLAGIAVTTLVGFSYRALFLACIVQQWLGAAAVYGIGRSLELGRAVSLILGLTLLLNPLYFGHAFTFMTDGPGAAWMAIAAFAAVRGLITCRHRWLLACALAVAWGFWMRQTNLAVLVAPLFGVTLLRWRRRSSLSYGRAVLVLSVLPLVAVLLFESGWIVDTDARRIEAFVEKDVTEGRAKQTLIGAYGMGLILGFSVLPLLPLMWSAARQSLARVTSQTGWLRTAPSLVGGGLTALAALPFVWTSGRACLTNATGMFLQNAHFGPVLLSDYDEPGRWGELGGVAWPLLVWQLLTVLALLSFGMLVWWFAWLVLRTFEAFHVARGADARHPRSRQTSSEPADSASSTRLALACGFGAASVLAAGFYLLVIVPVVDRYWLILLAPLLGALALMAREAEWSMPPGVLVLAAAVLLVELVWNVVFVHDLLAWNQARWQQVEAWLADGRSPQEIDGGVEVNAWLRLAEDPNSLPRPGDRSKWWSGFATLSIAAGPRNGWEEVGRVPWRAWATAREHQLRILRRQRPPPSSSRDHAELP